MTRRFFTISKPLIVLIFLFIAGNIYSQNITWYKIFDFRFQGNDAGSAICKADGENFFIVGSTGSRILLIKINQYGDTIFAKTVGQLVNRLANSIVPDGSNNFYITGDATLPFVVKINISGEVIWEKYYKTKLSTAQLFESKLFSDNSLVSCGRIGSWEGYIQKIDSSGNLIWNKTVNGGFYREYSGLEEDEVGNIVLAGHDFATSHFSKYSSDGEFIYEKNIGTIMPVKMKKVTHGYLIGGYNFGVQKVDTTGNVLSSKSFFNPGQTERLYDFKVINENKFIMCGLSISKSDTVYGKVIIGDTSGTTIHQKLFPNLNNYIIPKAAYPTQGGDILFAGFIERNNFPSHEDVLIIRTNQFLEGPTVEINSPENFVENFQLHQNYPNPFNPSTKISYSLKKSSAIELKLFDINGRMIKIIESGFKPAGSYEINFSAEGLSSGVYFFSLYSEGILMDTKKAVVLK